MGKTTKKLSISVSTDDNSITLSDALCKEIGIRHDRVAYIFVFRIKDTNTFAMRRVKRSFAATTPCGITHFNPNIKTTGFISMVPTVSYILYHMGIDAQQITISLVKQRLNDGGNIYLMKHDSGD